jgi:hypothetical protein
MKFPVEEMSVAPYESISPKKMTQSRNRSQSYRRNDALKGNNFVLQKFIVTIKAAKLKNLENCHVKGSTEKL